QVLNRRQRRAQPRVVGDLAVFQRDIEVDPHERALAIQRLRGKIPQAPLFQRRVPMNASRSTQRDEYPISLSYHDEMCTSVPSITAVDIVSITPEYKDPM